MSINGTKQRKVARRPNGSLPERNKGGRPSLYRPEYDHLAEVACEQLGARLEDLAVMFKVSVSAINDWVKGQPTFCDAVNRGRDAFDNCRVEDSLRRRAIGYVFDEVRVETVSVEAELPEGTRMQVPAKKITTTTREIPPDVTACIFWLVNRTRRTGRWVNAHKIEVSARHDYTHRHEVDLTKLATEELYALRTLLSKGQEGGEASSEQSNQGPGPAGTSRTAARGYFARDAAPALPGGRRL